MVELVRSFISIDVTDEGLIGKIVQIQNMLKETGGDLKLVEPENLHLTLRFLGEIPRSLLEEVCKEISNVKFKPFKLRFKGLGVFPSLNRINVVWVGVSEGWDEVKEVAEKVNVTLKKLSLPSDKKEFSPHLTVARVKSSRNRDKIAEIVKRFSDYDFGLFIVNCVRVKKSILMSKGPQYSTIMEVPALT
ncbi:MAG: RNA 2',3'-cyclic phosphodiesterase [Candidatus Bathyarchaeota archaeon]|nr:RNA 2',3'-cyclic phosphodiesterase [Candidatus Bathyarchaeota archaeon]